jgi:hypothetical protein
VVNCKCPARGALAAGVKDGPDKMVTAWDHRGIARISTVKQVRTVRYALFTIIKTKTF